MKLVWREASGRWPAWGWALLPAAGALLTASLVRGDDADARSARVLEGLSALAGTELSVDDDVARSEHLLGDRNHALAHLMRAEGALQVGGADGDVGEAVDVHAGDRIAPAGIGRESVRWGRYLCRPRRVSGP